jgi:hypothetical protein
MFHVKQQPFMARARSLSRARPLRIPHRVQHIVRSHRTSARSTDHNHTGAVRVVRVVRTRHWPPDDGDTGSDTHNNFSRDDPGRPIAATFVR